MGIQGENVRQEWQHVCLLKTDYLVESVNREKCLPYLFVNLFVSALLLVM